MFTKPKHPSELSTVYDTAVKQLKHHDPASAEYASLLDHVTKLHKMMEEDKPSRVSPDTAVLAAANLIGMVLVIKHEHVGIITTKALSMVPKIR